MNRARRLLQAGLIGGHLAAAACIATFWFIGGPQSGTSALVAAAATLAFYTVGLAVQVAVADAPPRRILIASLLSYASRVSVLALLAVWLTTGAASPLRLDASAVVVTTIGVVLGWLIAELRTYARLRIPVFDPPQTPGSPPEPGSASPR
ncbi:MAG: hypothetical protein ACK5LS_11620 [Propioniciclava sp.]